MKAFAEQGANPNAVNKLGDTAMHLAADHGHEAVVRGDTGFGVPD